jgi:hypothetical protein
MNHTLTPNDEQRAIEAERLARERRLRKDDLILQALSCLTREHIPAAEDEELLGEILLGLSPLVYQR